MAQRRIGQEQLRFGTGLGRRSCPLDEIAGLVGWARVDRHLGPIYASAKGEQA